MQLKISVITVTYNADKVLPKTLESILEQDSLDFEVVIKDGNSTDKTKSIILDYKKKFEQKGIPFQFICSPDEGIYDAMNCAVKIAKGDWVIFMNAGDCFANSKVLSKVIDNLDFNACFAYGDTIDRLYGYSKFSVAGDMSELTSHMPTSHQSIFTKRSYLINYPFKTEYRFAADYGLLLYAYINNVKFQKLGFVISCYSREGVSEVNFSKGLEEMKKIQQECGIKQNGKLKTIFIVWRVRLRNFMRKYFPRLYFTNKRGWTKEYDK